MSDSENKMVNDQNDFLHRLRVFTGEKKRSLTGNPVWNQLFLSDTPPQMANLSSTSLRIPYLCPICLDGHFTRLIQSDQDLMRPFREPLKRD